MTHELILLCPAVHDRLSASESSHMHGGGVTYIYMMYQGEHVARGPISAFEVCN